MLLKKVLDSLDGLDAALHGVYKKGDDGKFYLQVEGGMGEGGEELAALRSAKEHEKNLRVAAENKVSELERQTGALTQERDTAIQERDAAKADKGADVQALEASWSTKLETEKAAHKATKDALVGEVERILVVGTAETLAAEISTVPELFSGVIAGRLRAEKGADDKYFIRVLDAAGTPSAMTVDEYKKELLANEKYATIIISGKGSGGGATGAGSGGGAAEKKYLDHTDQELVDLRKSDPAKYDRLLTEYRKAG